MNPMQTAWRLLKFASDEEGAEETRARRAAAAMERGNGEDDVDSPIPQPVPEEEPEEWHGMGSMDNHATLQEMCADMSDEQCQDMFQNFMMFRGAQQDTDAMEDEDEEVGEDEYE